ncbi:MAG: exonuclease domain-containing protein [Clostridia bacterium]|nr:exonuclease domain-containing protein [Clostridia bacterium]
MQYVVMDLEWNNTYAKKTAGFINEIIEIGAVKLDEQFDTVDDFSCIIRSQIGRKLRGSVKKLTNLTNDDISTGMPFTQAFSHFRKWIGNTDDTVILTWGDGDIRVLIENYSYLNGITQIPFLTHYCDLQKYYQKRANRNRADQQAGLITAAQEVGIDPEIYTHHRALGDSMLTADIFELIYDKKSFEKETVVCNDEYYARLLYKAKVLKNIDNPLIDKKRLEHYCDTCGKQCELISPWKFSCQFFRAQFNCPECNTTYGVRVRFKKLFDGVDFKKIVTVISPELDSEEDDDE